jgi:hypothetical protein
MSVQHLLTASLLLLLLLLLSQLIQGWDRTSTCTPCGEGLWLSEPQDALIFYEPATNFGSIVYVHGSPNSCYIQKGMGVDSTGRASICPPITFGNDAERRYGTDPAPCVSCLTGLVTSDSNNFQTTAYNDSQGAVVAIKEGGYFNVGACVTPPGYGYALYGAEECAVGTYNEGGNLFPCKR